VGDFPPSEITRFWIQNSRLRCKSKVDASPILTGSAVFFRVAEPGRQLVSVLAVLIVTGWLKETSGPIDKTKTVFRPVPLIHRSASLAPFPPVARRLPADNVALRAG
jgi:hypothetical protein